MIRVINAILDPLVCPQVPTARFVHMVHTVSVRLPHASHVLLELTAVRIQVSAMHVVLVHLVQPAAGLAQSALLAPSVEIQAFLAHLVQRDTIQMVPPVSRYVLFALLEPSHCLEMDRVQLVLLDSGAPLVAQRAKLASLGTRVRRVPLNVWLVLRDSIIKGLVMRPAMHAH